MNAGQELVTVKPAGHAMQKAVTRFFFYNEINLTKMQLFGDVTSDPDFKEGTGWEDAQKQCQQKAGGAAGAGLAIFPNIHYQYFATSRMRNSGRTVWIGAKSTMQDSTFHWWDKSRLTYTNWMPNEPND